MRLLPRLWILGAALAAAPATAQNQGLVARDGTLGSAPKGVVQPGPDDLGTASYLIRADLGEQRGGNLFHSFSKFSIGSGERATFTADGAPDPGAIDNVISRVTGPDPSQIDGTLHSTIQGADVWLLNPSGVMFGEGAKLDVPGSFHASTGDYLGFGQGGLERFYADGRPSSVLSTAPPEAFGFLGEHAPAPISVTGATLEVPDGKTLELSGGDVTLSGATLDTPGGAVSIRGGRIVVDEGSKVLAESTTDRPGGAITVDASDSLLVDHGLLSVNTDSAGAAGTIRVAGGPVILRGGSGFVSGLPQHYDAGLTAETSGSGAAGGIAIDAKSLEVTDGAAVSAQTVGARGVKATGPGGEIHVASESVHVADLASIVVDSWASRGDAGAITIAADELRLDGVPGDFYTGVSADSFAPSGLSHGSAGSIAIEAGSVRAAGQGSINAVCWCDADGVGRIQIRAGSLALEGGGRLHADTRGPGTAGTIEVRAESVRVGPGEGSFISTSSSPGGLGTPGAAGTIDVEATRSILLTNEGAPRHPFLETLKKNLFTGVFSATVQGGAGGSIRLAAPEITVREGAVAATTTLGGGRGGDVLLEGRRLLVANGGIVDSTSAPPQPEPEPNLDSFVPSGDAGTVRLTASDSIEVRGRDPAPGQFLGGVSRVSSLSLGSGAAGAVMLTAPRIVVDEGAVLTTALASGLGREGTRGGAITFDADELLVTNGGQVAASTFIAGDGGKIEVRARESIRVEGRDSEIASSTGGPGAGGGVELEAPRIEVEEGGQVSVKSEPGFGALGEIVARIEPDLVGPAPDQATGNAGALRLVTDELLLRGGTLASNAQTADGGDVTIRAKHLVRLDAGEITAAVNDGAGGNIAIDPALVLLEHGSRIVANAGAGTGGNIQITADDYFAFPKSVVDASSDLGVDGIVAVHAPDVNLAGQLTPLPTTYLDAASLMKERCAARRNGERAGSFSVRGNGGIPAEPDGWLPAPVVPEAAAGALPIIATIGTAGGVPGLGDSGTCR